MLIFLTSSTLSRQHLMKSDCGMSWQTTANTSPPDFYYQAMSIINQADLNYRTASNKQFLTELTIIQLCQLLSPAAPAMAPGGN